jgi:predicted transcriptional regulator
MEITDTDILDVTLLSDSDLITVQSDKEIELIVKALSSKTRRKILRNIQEEPMDISDIAADLNMTEANISAQVKKLEGASLISCDYTAGEHGVRKISRIRFNELRIKF